MAAVAVDDSNPEAPTPHGGHNSYLEEHSSVSQHGRHVSLSAVGNPNGVFEPRQLLRVYQTLLFFLAMLTIVIGTFTCSRRKRRK